VISRIALASLLVLQAGCLSKAAQSEQSATESSAAAQLAESQQAEVQTAETQGVRTQAASEMDELEAAAIERLSWVDGADAESAARSALSGGGRPVLLSSGGRGMSLPGIEPGEHALLLQHCDVEILEGAGDVVYGDRHLDYLQRAHDYAARYNRRISARCRGE